MQSYRYNSSIGSFMIKQVGHCRYELWIQDELLGVYENAELAAKDVATFNTNHVKWDRFENQLDNYPKNLSDWSQVEEESPRY